MLIFAACSENTDNLPVGNGKITVKLTDNPVEFDEVNVEILSVMFHYTGTDMDDDMNENDTIGNDDEYADTSDVDDDYNDTTDYDDGEWIELDTEAGIYNLLMYQNELDTVIASSDFPTGKVTQIRLLLGNNNYLVSGEDTTDLFTPSAQQSGLKINFNYEIRPDEEMVVTLDFDAAKSIVVTGNGKHILKPVIKVKNVEYIE